MEFKVLDCCPTPETNHFDEVVAELLSASGATLESCYRGEAKNAQQYLTGNAPCFKHNQAWIYANYPPGVANPPGRSTHELFNDGAAYPVPAGTLLEYWQVGLDIRVERLFQFMEEGRKRGFVITQTYPGSAVEAHHVNFRFEPHYVPPFEPINRGDHDARVRKLSRRLHYIRAPHGAPYLQRPKSKLWVPYGTFRPEVEKAVEHFQRNHHLQPDGEVGIHTFEQIERTFRHQWQHRHHGKDAPKRHMVDLAK